MLAEDSDDTLSQNWLIAKRFKVLVISILPILCLIASRLRSSLATYAPNISSASAPWRVYVKVSNSFPEVSEVSTDSLGFTFFNLVLLLGSGCFGESLAVNMFSAMLKEQFAYLTSRKFHQEHLRSEHPFSMVQRCHSFHIPYFRLVVNLISLFSRK